MAIRYIDQIDLKGKRVLIRVDFNVSLDENKNITDDIRVTSVLPTITYALNNDAKVILMSHLGRPKGAVNPALSLLPVANHLSAVLKKSVLLAPDCVGPDVETMVSAMKPQDLLLLENIRFHAEEEKNDREFARKLARLADVYINDAFATAHRAHASNAAIIEFVGEYGAGFLMKNEIEYLRKAMENPDRPLVAIVGGAKVSGKLGTLENLIRKVDKLIIGGGMAFTFLKARGVDVGSSLVEDELIETALRIMDSACKRKVKLYLPVDCVAAEKLEAGAVTVTTPIQELPAGWMGLDIGPATETLFAEVLRDAKTIVWNGPMGVFEMDAFSNGTRSILTAVAESPALTIVGGGDTNVAVYKWNAADRISYISTGGGAFIEMLEGKTLPAIKALEGAG
ncbi:MAG: phosphoglycerate kinase [Deltaproteobacteria bacterium]|nr:phosphoglycerate kinase [Deltaproteobacteria bacterium]